MRCVSEDEEKERKPVAMVGERRETSERGPGLVRFDVGVGVGGWVSIALEVEALEGYVKV